MKNWSFKSLQNSLVVVFATQSTTSTATTAQENQCGEVNSAVDENGNLLWFSLNIDGVTLYLPISYYKIFRKKLKKEKIRKIRIRSRN